MKVVFVLMKGFDGCGVSRFAVEHQKELRRLGHECDIYSFNKKYSRANSHKDKDVKYYKNLTDVDFSKYDIFILNSYEKEFKQEDLDYYKSLPCKKVAMMHEIIKQNYGRIPHLWDWIDASDIVSSFSGEMDFTQDLIKRNPDVKYFSFKMAMSDEELDRLYQNSLNRDRRNALIYYGRWTTMKDPHRLLDYKTLDPSLDLMCLGIERSMGSFWDLASGPYSNRPKAPGFIDTRKKFDDVEKPADKVNILPPVDRDLALQILNEVMFGASFYRLDDKRVHNLGNRMEFTQIEISSVCMPVFDKSWGEHTFDSLTGKSFYELGDNAVYSDKNNLQESIDEMKYLAEHKDEYDRRRQNIFDIVKRNFGATENIKTFYDHINNEVFDKVEVRG